MKNPRTLEAILVVTLLLLGPAVALPAQESSTAPAAQQEQVTLTGQLAAGERGGFVLVEQESGDSVVLRGPVELADYVGSKVQVTGTWVEESEATYLQVATIETM